jgi:flagellar hook-associated protein 3 FlgL
MAIARMTQKMLSQQALTGMQTGLDRLARVQEQLTTGKLINRPSDDPTGAVSAMRFRVSVSEQQQYARNANDAVAWLNQIDATLSSMTGQVRRARDVALQGANEGSMGPQAREALAIEIDQLREGLIQTSNASYLGRPVFGGVTGGTESYDAATGTWQGVPGAVVRTVADGVKIRVDVEGPDVVGADGDNLFGHLTALSLALRTNDQPAIAAAIDRLSADSARITDVQSAVGARTVRVEQAQKAAGDAELSLTSSLAEIENTDLAKATVDLQLQEVAYQAALAATARVMQPSLLDFLR